MYVYQWGGRETIFSYIFLDVKSQPYDVVRGTVRWEAATSDRPTQRLTMETFFQFGLFRHVCIDKYAI